MVWSGFDGKAGGLNMIKRELLETRSLRATKRMRETAACDKPQRNEGYYSSWLVYKYCLYIRCCIYNGILKTAIFFAEHLRSGGCNPAYELFINKDNGKFITYDRLHDKWLNSKLDILPFPDYAVRYSDNVWVTQSDSDAIKEYLGGEKGGFAGLLEYQLHIRAEELMKRHKKTTDIWDEDLAQIPPLPKDWERWVDKVGIRDNYIFYEYSRKGVNTGYCTFCGKDVPIKQPKYGAHKTCVCCRHKVTFKSVGKAGTVVTNRNMAYLIQRCRDGFVIRQFQAYRIYYKGEYTKPKCSWSEIRRSIYDANGRAMRAYYWGLYKQKYTRWIRTGVCGPGCWGGDEGRVYGKTIPHLAKLELSRTGLPEMLRNAGSIDPEKYLAVLREVPQMEKIAKAKLPNMVRECISRYYSFREGVHNIGAASLTEMLGINTQELKRLRRNDGGFDFLRWLRFEKAAGRIIPDNIIAWFCSEQIMPEALRFIQNKMSVVQIYNYIRRQMSVYEGKSNEIITKWSDYLSMAKRLKMDTGDEIIFKVNRLYERHDELVERCHEKDVAIQAGEILEKYPHVDEICESIREKYEYADNDYTVLVPNCVEDIIFEGRNLHHCVAGSERYWERIERRETYILYLRRSCDIGKSYYTLEIEPNGTVRQKRTMYDRQEPDIEDAKKFLEKWQMVIAGRLTPEDRQLAKESRELRDKSYAQLRNDGIIVHTGELAGKLLVDILLADLMENAG